jgi:methylated-DNA-[protein]-cysteine S-methyltransferase
MYSSFYNSPIGLLKIEATQNSVYSVSFSDEPDSLTQSNDLCEKCKEQLEDYFSGKLFQFDIPKEQKGTLFQQKVWEQLSTIPYGKTISYLTLSKSIGDPKAIRAVGTANGRNNIAIIVPCHRVIGSNAKLTGYAGGLWRKQWLLEHEAKHFSGLQLLPF